MLPCGACYCIASGTRANTDIPTGVTTECAGLTISPSCDARKVPEVGSLALGDLAYPEVIIQMETPADVVPQGGKQRRLLCCLHALYHLQTQTCSTKVNPSNVANVDMGHAKHMDVPKPMAQNCVYETQCRESSTTYKDCFASCLSGRHDRCPESISTACP